METYDELVQLSEKYKIPVEDVLFIALNRYGIKMNVEDNRIRMKVKLNQLDELFYLAVGVNTYKDTKFEIVDNILLFDKDPIGKIIELEKDTCDSTYFRKDKKEITLNSNSRSQCSGCKFCGTYNLDPNDISDLTNEESLKRYMETFLKQNGMESLQDVEGITVCTGCFSTEKEVVDHLKFLKNALSYFKFNKKLKYIGSQIRSDEALEEIASSIGDFGLFITTEKFSEREKFMRADKASLNLEKTIDLIERSTKLGFDTTILYILGLEQLSDFETNMRLLSKNMNKYPLVQIYQNYVADQEVYRIPEAKGVEYYLQARQILENIFDKDELKPESWENYRGLSYTTHKSKPHKSVRI